MKSIVIPWFKPISMLHSNTPSPGVFEGNDDWNGRTIWSCATSSWHYLKRARSKPNWIALYNSTVGESAPMQTVKQPVTLESFNHWETLKMLLLSDVELWQIISVALLILLQAFKRRVYIYMYMLVNLFTQFSTKSNLKDSKFQTWQNIKKYFNNIS